MRVADDPLHAGEPPRRQIPQKPRPDRGLFAGAHVPQPIAASVGVGPGDPHQRHAEDEVPLPPLEGWGLQPHRRIGRRQRAPPDDGYALIPALTVRRDR